MTDLFALKVIFVGVPLLLSVVIILQLIDTYKKMKRYILFAGDVYYPRGGARDLVGYRDSVEECKQLFYAIRGSDIALDFFNDVDYTEHHWAHVFDTENNSIVLTLSRDVWEELK